MIEKDTFDLRQTVPHVLRHSHTKYALDLAILESEIQFFDGRYAELLVDTKNATRIETGMRTQLDEFRGCA
jgi:hypothetical protein